MYFLFVLSAINPPNGRIHITGMRYAVPVAVAYLYVEPIKGFIE